MRQQHVRQEILWGTEAASSVLSPALATACVQPRCLHVIQRPPLARALYCGGIDTQSNG